MTTSKKKRKCLLACARKGMLLTQVNQRLKEECLDETNKEEWVLWSNYYVGIIKDDPYFEHELINNNRPLSWFAVELNRRRQKKMTS